ncbi:MAG: GspE/PulE family protein [Pirellulales bacterium]
MMLRHWRVPAAALAFWAFQVQQAFAEAWPDYTLKEPLRGPGYYLNVWKILGAWLVFLCWVRTTDWVSQDARTIKTNYARWNSLIFFSFVASFLLLWILPIYWLGLTLMILAYGGPLIAYVIHRNGLVLPHQKVLTRAHLRFWIAEHLTMIGIKVSHEKQDPRERGAPVTLVSQGGATDRDNAANLLAARQSLGYPVARELLADAVSQRADSVAMDFTQQAVAIRYQIDGVWHNNEPRDRESGDAMLAVLKMISARNPNERRARQEGAFKAEYEKITYSCTLTCQGTDTGERALLQIQHGKVAFKSFEELGMRPKIQEQIVELLGKPAGLVLVSAPPDGGLTSTFNVVVDSTDRFTRNFVAVEDQSKYFQPIENCPATLYNSKKGESPATVLPKLLRTYPDVVVVRDLVNGETVEILANQVNESRLVISSVRAKGAAEALLQVLAMKVTPSKLAEAIQGIVNQRLVRRLCEKCKEAYAPPPQVLQQLGIPAGRVEAFYRPPEPSPEQQQREEPCTECNGIGYVGRIAIFEVLMPNERIRKVLTASPKLEILRQEARKAGMRSLQDDGILLVARGVTSLAELMRVLKQ